MPEPTDRRPGVILTRSISDVRPGDTLITRWPPRRMPPDTRCLISLGPSGSLLAAAQDGLPWEDYRRRYLAEMRVAYQGPLRRVLEGLVDRAGKEGLALVCFCATAEVPAQTHCHRIVLADEVLAPLGRARGVDLRVDHR